MAEPAHCNECVTLAHQELSLALHSVTGAASGANFHTWAVWGSKKAGTTIRRQDVPWLGPAAGGVAAISGALASSAVRWPPNGRRWRAAGGALAGGYAGGRYSSALKRRAAERILAGNITVLDDIGRQTGRFVSTFLAAGSLTEPNLEQFLTQLLPGSASEGGQDLLSAAYRSYFAAARESDPDQRDEHMLLANLNAILHEHWRLDPYIDASLPKPVRRFVTRDLLDVSLGAEHLRIGADLPAPAADYPSTLASIQNPTLHAFLYGPTGWDRTPDTLAGSGAQDWTEIGDRMNYIVDLFRSRHHDPNVFTPPYPDEVRDRILARTPQ